VSRASPLPEIRLRDAGITATALPDLHQDATFPGVRSAADQNHIGDQMLVKKLVAISSLAACGMAIAQSSVTLYGTVDIGFQKGTGSIADRSQVAGSGLSSSLLGFRIREDFGGGWGAGAWLEASLNPGNGTGVATNTNNQTSGTRSPIGGSQGLTFNRWSLARLFTPFGELQAGRRFTPQYLNLSGFDPFTALGVGGAQPVRSIVTAPFSTILSNTIAYVSPNIRGFWGEAAYFLGENASNAPNKDDGSGYGVRVGYKKGAISSALAVGRLKYLTGNRSQSNLAASYDFGFAKVTGMVTRDSLGPLDGRGFLIGGSVPFGVNLIRVSYAGYRADAATARPETRKIALGIVHNLSKRTALYATYARANNSGGASHALGNALTGPNMSSSGFDLGLRHFF
jgi:predicted porin